MQLLISVRRRLSVTPLTYAHRRLALEVVISQQNGFVNFIRTIRFSTKKALETSRNEVI